MPLASYASRQSARKSRAHRKLSHFGAVMKDHSQSDKENPYSPLLCILILLMAGIFVKTGGATQLFHLAQN